MFFNSPFGGLPGNLPFFTYIIFFRSGETSRARRFNRGIKTIKDLIKQVNSGKAINPEDIPPEVSTGENRKPEAPTAPLPEPVPEPEPVSEPEPITEPEPEPKNLETINMLKQRRDEYRIAAVKVKKTGDVQQAVALMKIGKQFDLVIKAVEDGQNVDLSNIPGPPVISEAGTSRTIPEPPPPQREENEVQNAPDEEPVAEPEPEPGLINPENFLDGLIQRLDVYKKQEENAKAEGNSGKARRMGRIIKQYESAVKATKLGKPYPLDELPNPPGFVPIVTVPDEPKPAPAAPPRPAPAPPSEDKPTPPPRSASVRKTGNQVPTSFNDRQVADLLNRQKEFKEAALRAKQKGEIAQAKEYLRSAKGFDKVIEAARCGLPVEMESLPIPPNARSKIEDR